MPVNGNAGPLSAAAGVAGAALVCGFDASGTFFVETGTFGGVSGAFTALFGVGGGVVVCTTGVFGFVAGVGGAAVVGGVEPCATGACGAGACRACGAGVGASGAAGGVKTCCCPYWSSAAEIGSAFAEVTPARATPAAVARRTSDRTPAIDTSIRRPRCERTRGSKSRRLGMSRLYPSGRKIFEVLRKIWAGDHERLSGRPPFTAAEPRRLSAHSQAAKVACRRDGGADHGTDAGVLADRVEGLPRVGGCPPQPAGHRRSGHRSA